jgi:hypothetical protein
MREGRILLDKWQEQEFYPPLFLDYKYNAGKIKGLYAHHYQEAGHYRDKAAFLRERFPGENRRGLVSALQSYNETL